MKFQLRPFQTAVVEDAVDFVIGARPGQKRLYASPTGTGKSVIELAIQERLHALQVKTWIVTPRVEIVAGLLDKQGTDAGSLSERALVDLAWDRRITTPIRLRNALLKGEGPEDIAALVIDEAHHDLAETYLQLAVLAGRVPCVGLTASPYRGTPRGTLAFRESWGEPVWAITIPEAVEEGYLSFPAMRIVPLVDDETLEVSNGEFATASVNKATLSRVEGLVDVIREHTDGAGLPTRPTMVAVPSVEVAESLATLCRAAGLAVETVTGRTSAADRSRIFRAVVGRDAILIQINVVSEGVDLPIRVLIDAAPTLSPVMFCQRLGRITRPIGPREGPPSYVGCNRNLLRHAYLMEGMIPRAVLVEGQKQFPVSGVRSATGRVVGLESIGRLKPAPLPMRDGLEAYLYAMSAVEGSRVVQYAVIVHPLEPDPTWACRTNERGEDGVTATYGRWRACGAPPDLTGFASLPGSPVSEKQLAWWKRSARRHGLDPSIEPTRKQFAALPVLADLGARLS